MEQLSPGATTPETPEPGSCRDRSPRTVEALLHSERGHHDEKPHTATRAEPHLLQLEKDPAQPQIKSKINKQIK